MSPHLHASGLLPVEGPTYIPDTTYDGTSIYISSEPPRSVNNAGTNVYSNVAMLNNPAPMPDTYWYRAIRSGFGEASKVTLPGLGQASGHRDSQRAYAVSETGIIGGSSTKIDVNGNSLGERAVLWNQAGQITELGSLGTDAAGSTSGAVKVVNASGAAAGYAYEHTPGKPPVARAVRWNAGSTVATRLGDFNTDFGDGSNYVSVRDMNDSGVAVGAGTLVINDVSQGSRALRWDANTSTPTVLGAIETYGKWSSSPNSINNSGVIVGSSDKRAFSGTSLGSRAVRWDVAGNASELGNLGTRSTGYTTASAYHGNEAGDAVGFAELYVGGVDKGSRPVRWNAGQTLATELPNLGTTAAGSTSGAAYAINELGSIVGRLGYTTEFGYSDRAILWLPGATNATDLNTLVDPASGWTLTQAQCVSDTGFIVGVGLHDPDLSGAEIEDARQFTLLVPEAGTYGRGDANFDTHVNFDDLLLLAQHYGESNASQNIHVGDFDLNGSVNFDDLLTLAQHYESGAMIDLSALGATFTSDWTLARSMVPEPTSMVAGFGALAGMCRRRAV